MRPGLVVRSMAGHDKDRFYVVVKVDEGYAWIADGKERRLAKPKRKNPRHLAPTTTIIEQDTITSDRKLHALLRPFYGEAAPTEREGIQLCRNQT